MLHRRKLIQAATATATVTAISSVIAQSCSSEEDSYKKAVSQIWRHSVKNTELTDKRALQRELVRYSTLAASSHNTQCWKFKLEDRLISIMPDLKRRCPAVDPDDHHLYTSLGCATENLLQASKAFGLQGTVELESAAPIKIHLESTNPFSSSLFKAIPKRQSTRTEYDGQTLENKELKQLEQAATGDGVNLIMITEKQAMEKILEYVIEGNTAQINDPAFVEELKSWIRFNSTEAIREGDGLFSQSSGNPSAPNWLGSILFDLFFTSKAENKKYTNQIRSSAGIAIFVSEEDNQSNWIRAGQSYQRFALQAAALDIRTAFLNQPVEVETLRPQFANYLEIGNRRPDLVVRFGRGPEMPRSLRRAVESVIL